MKSFSHLDDHQCEVLKGGVFDVTNITMTSFASSLVGVGQSNNATNVGLGLLVGLGNAQSIQGNGAVITSFVL
jgi:hypothetical protein